MFPFQLIRRSSFWQITRFDLTPQATPSPSHRCCQLGTDMLVRAFAAHDVVRCDIVDQLLSRIIAKRGEAITHYIRTLNM